MVNLISYLGHIVCSAYFGAAPKRRATLTLDCVNFVNFVRKSDSLASARITDHSGVHLEIPVLHPSPLVSAHVRPRNSPYALCACNDLLRKWHEKFVHPLFYKNEGSTRSLLTVRVGRL